MPLDASAVYILYSLKVDVYRHLITAIIIFMINSLIFLGVEGKHMAYAGVGPDLTENDEQIKHTYYQWVCFVLLGQSVMFYTPRYLWKIWEGGRLKALAADLSKNSKHIYYKL